MSSLVNGVVNGVVNVLRRGNKLLPLLVTAGFWLWQPALPAQTPTDPPQAAAATQSPGHEPPMMGDRVVTHIFFDQLEGRTAAAGSEFRWDGEGWTGSDLNRLWIKSEGFAANGMVSDGDQQFLYDRPIPRVRYFDMQAGVRADLDSGPRRVWAAFGIEGLAPYWFEVAPTLYIRDGGNVAGRIETFEDLRITQRLVAQPEAELNFYSKDDRSRSVGSGLSELDGGLRLRYEFSRKFAPYAGYAYNGKFGNSAIYAPDSGEPAHESSFVFGLYVWY